MLKFSYKWKRVKFINDRHRLLLKVYYIFMKINLEIKYLQIKYFFEKNCTFRFIKLFKCKIRSLKKEGTFVNIWTFKPMFQIFSCVLLGFISFYKLKLVSFKSKNLLYHYFDFFTSLCLYSNLSLIYAHCVHRKKCLKIWEIVKIWEVPNILL